MSRIIAICILLQLAIAGCTPTNDRASSDEVDQATTQLNEYPELVLRLTDGKEIHARDLKGNNVFVMFQPDCDHCQVEAVHIEQRLEDFKGYNLFFISSAPMEHIAAFARNFKLDNKDNVSFAWTAPDGVINSYGPIRTPSIYIYSNKQLKASFNGQTDIDEILNAL